MKKKKPLPPPQEVVEQFIEQVYDNHGTAAGIAYEALRQQHNSGEMGRALIGEYMRKHFDVCPVPEDRYWGEE